MFYKSLCKNEQKIQIKDKIKTNANKTKNTPNKDEIRAVYKKLKSVQHIKKKNTCINSKIIDLERKKFKIHTQNTTMAQKCLAKFFKLIK